MAHKSTIDYKKIVGIIKVIGIIKSSEVEKIKTTKSE